METLQEFLEKIPHEEHRSKLAGVIEWVETTFPEVETQIKWNQPMIILEGTFVISFSASQKHFAVAPERKILDEFRDELDVAGYSHSKALFRILWTQDVNYPLLEQIIKHSIEFKRGSKTFWAH